MRRDLENGVRRSIDDEFPRLHLLIAIISYDLGAGIWPIDQDAPASRLRKGIQHILGKAVWIDRQRFGRDDPSNLPVADGRILPHGALCHLAPSAPGGICPAQKFQPRDKAEAGAAQVGDL